MILIITIPGLVFDHIIVSLRSCSFQVVLRLLFYVCYALVSCFLVFIHLWMWQFPGTFLKILVQ